MISASPFNLKVYQSTKTVIFLKFLIECIKKPSINSASLFCWLIETSKYEENMKTKNDTSHMELGFQVTL